MPMETGSLAPSGPGQAHDAAWGIVHIVWGDNTCCILPDADMMQPGQTYDVTLTDI